MRATDKVLSTVATAQDASPSIFTQKASAFCGTSAVPAPDDICCAATVERRSAKTAHRSELRSSQLETPEEEWDVTSALSRMGSRREPRTWPTHAHQRAQSAVVSARSGAERKSGGHTEKKTA
jgi:hypothetical protein